ncbi:AAA family ATPase [Streptomyces sp. NPDC085932]|uniref:helix-turn-helix transcriptional regulator n=1 Tax=Streptomyces sp. NPDC085932 TaxID=3365741 RepID=UPI0037D48842
MSRPFVGRHDELAALGIATAQARDGQSSLVELRGAAGTGKTTLIRHWLSCPELKRSTVLRAACDQAERDHPFGMMGQFISQLPIDIRAQFPELVANLERGIPARIGAAFLQLLEVLQISDLLIIVVDDIQWADLASLQALGYALRRLHTGSLLMVFSAREEEPVSEYLCRLMRDYPNVRRLALSGLSEREVAELARYHEMSLEWHDIRRLHAYTAGNPLCVLILLSHHSHQATDRIDDLLATPPSLTAAVRQKLDHLPSRSRRLVEASAILDSQQPLALVGQLAGLDEVTAALEPALTAGLLRWWPEVPSTLIAVSHALHRDAIYSAMSPEDRRRLHAAAVPLVDRDASWRHRVAATDTADAGLAAELEQEALRQFSANGGRAATLLLWAADLSESRHMREKRLLSAAVGLQLRLDFAGAERLLSAVRACAACGLRSAVLGAQAAVHGESEVAQSLLSEALDFRQPESDDATVAAHLGLGRLHAWWGRGSELIETADRIGHPTDVTLKTFATYFRCAGHVYLHGPQAGLDQLEQSADIPLGIAPTSAGHDFLLAHRGLWRLMSGDFEKSITDAESALQLSPSNSIARVDDVSYYTMSAAQFFLGKWEDAGINAERAILEAEAMKRTWSFAPSRIAAALVAVGRGEFERAHSLITDLDRITSQYGPEQYIVYSATAAAFLAQAREDYPAMLTAIAPLLNQTVTGWVLAYQSWWLPFLVEALLETGHYDEAEHHLTVLTALEGTMPYLRAARARLSGRSAETRGDFALARQTYKQALEEDSPQDPPLFRALLAEANGSLLKRMGRRVHAAASLRQAAERFEAIGARPFAERCFRALTALGSMPGRAEHGDSCGSRLTDREWDIAQLISRGLTNKEIAAHLYVSTKTVEYHLGKTYLKLGISGRRQLRDYMRRHPGAGEAR